MHSEVMLQVNLLRKQEEEMMKKRDELLEHQNQLKQELVSTGRHLKTHI